MLALEFYLCCIHGFKPEFGYHELSRLRQLPDLDLEKVGETLELPKDWLKLSERWYYHQSEISQVIWCFHPLYPLQDRPLAPIILIVGLKASNPGR